ncbi:Hsp33 family molecular chaperone HslO, partial [Acinetobacter baumannii]
MPGQTAYQGIVPLVDEHQQPLQSIAQILELYMAQSEQLETRLILTSNSMRAAG